MDNTMSKRKLELSRRKTLAALGTIGAASAGAGLGTSAYFSDQETFENNELVAGELDLKIDWEEHYSNWSEDEATAAPGTRMVDSADDVDDDEIGLPNAEDPLVAVPNDQLGAFMDATAVEAYPDDDNGGDGNSIQDPLSGFDECVDFADTPEDLDPNGGTGLRTANADTLDENGNPKPLVSLDDVKPGDFGELTLSFHLCDNPGFIWLQGDPVRAAENGYTEPEADDGDEVGDSTEVATGSDVLDSDVELLDAIQTLLWYDEDGDNVYEPGGAGEPVDLDIVFDQSESMNGFPSDTDPTKLQNAVNGAKALVDAVGPDTNLGLTFFSTPPATGVVRPLGSSRSDIKLDLDELIAPDTPTGNTPNDNNFGGLADPDSSLAPDDDNLIQQTDIPGGVEAATNELTGPNARDEARQIMVILTDGVSTEGNPTDEAAAAKSQGIEIFTIAYGGGANTGQLETMASSPKDTHAFVSSGPGDIEMIFSQLGQVISGEERFFQGSLRDLLTELDSGLGIPLDGNRDTLFNEIDDDPASEAREEFVNSTNNFIGFAWYLPVDHANEIQSDSVSFDLGFYTEQSRHNDGSGMNSADVDDS
jgi:predicted ribosomally synthesized peptide with SipW-like signal peptide